jgi:hypothetical protein
MSNLSLGLSLVDPDEAPKPCIFWKIPLLTEGGARMRSVTGARNTELLNRMTDSDADRIRLDRPESSACAARPSRP